MNSIFQTYGCLCLFCISLFLVLTSLSAAPTGEIIFVHPVSDGEIWISNAEGTTARKLFRQAFSDIDKIEVQEDGNYVLVVAGKAIFEGNNIQAFSGFELFLLDRQHPGRKAKDLTLGRITDFVDADISKNGDVAFIRRPGIRLIRNEELAKPEPKIELLFDAMEWDSNLFDIEWSPDGKHIAFTTHDGLYLLDVATKDVFRITEKDAYNPVFSPNGKQIAYSTVLARNGKLWTTAIAVISVQPNAEPEIVHVKKDYIYGVDSWSPNGKFIAYSSYTHKELVNIELFRSRGNFVIPATGGEPEPILITMKDTVLSLDWDNKTYPVEPADSLVTTWGKLKAQK
ncbi:MAG: DPP IV N-terminal domain-containing protein [Candidatus Poribacteria bacterium]|nr:DPP IV N-terminal domain-containing protein [Candidatus Poribacteria bacterium]